MLYAQRHVCNMYMCRHVYVLNVCVYVDTCTPICMYICLYVYTYICIRVLVYPDQRLLHCFVRPNVGGLTHVKSGYIHVHTYIHTCIMTVNFSKTEPCDKRLNKLDSRFQKDVCRYVNMYGVCIMYVRFFSVCLYVSMYAYKYRNMRVSIYVRTPPFRTSALCFNVKMDFNTAKVSIKLRASAKSNTWNLLISRVPAEVRDKSISH